MLKEKLELLVERLSDRDAAQRDYALKEFKIEIAGATSSMTSVPKPLKFLSPHYKKIQEVYELQLDSQFKVSNFSIVVGN
jgi:26S proteasome regulatory subunit N1